MTKSQLAQELRQRQYDKGIVKRRVIDALSDDQMIDCYITCSCCGVKQVDEKQLVSAIHIAKDVNQFFQICDQINCCQTGQEST